MKKKENYKLLEKAIRIAVNAHFGQTDKVGVPYIFHPLRVMDNCSNEDEKIVAILHDTIEDTEISVEYLIAEQFPLYIVEAIEALTKRKNESYDNFINRLICNKLATVVKIEDIKDNMDTSRLIEIGEEDINRLKKYLQALRILKESIS